MDEHERNRVRYLCNPCFCGDCVHESPFKPHYTLDAYEEAKRDIDYLNRVRRDRMGQILFDWKDCRLEHPLDDSGYPRGRNRGLVDGTARTKEKTVQAKATGTEDVGNPPGGKRFNRMSLRECECCGRLFEVNKKWTEGFCPRCFNPWSIPYPNLIVPDLDDCPLPLSVHVLDPDATVNVEVGEAPGDEDCLGAPCLDLKPFSKEDQKILDTLYPSYIIDVSEYEKQKIAELAPGSIVFVKHEGFSFYGPDCPPDPPKEWDTTDHVNRHLQEAERFNNFLHTHSPWWITTAYDWRDVVEAFGGVWYSCLSDYDKEEFSL